MHGNIQRTYKCINRLILLFVAIFSICRNNKTLPDQKPLKERLKALVALDNLHQNGESPTFDSINYIYKIVFSSGIIIHFEETANFQLKTLGMALALVMFYNGNKQSKSHKRLKR